MVDVSRTPPTTEPLAAGGLPGSFVAVPRAAGAVGPAETPLCSPFFVPPAGSAWLSSRPTGTLRWFWQKEIEERNTVIYVTRPDGPVSHHSQCVLRPT